METANPYVKQFPDLFAGKAILYVHGFGSSGQSGTVDRLRQVFPQARVVAPDLPIHPQEALELLRQTCAQEQPSLILGTSMGGMYAEQLYGYDRILVNPAFQIADTMQAHGLTGKQQFSNPRRDGVQDFYVDKPLLKEYRLAAAQNFAHAADEGEQRRVYALFGDRDPLVHTRPLYEQHYRQAIAFHGEHRMNDHSFMHAVVPVMRWVDDRQERRERPIIYIGMETLLDPYGHPTASSQKAVALLAERYQVFFVAQAQPMGADGGAPRYAETLAWLQEYIGTPAWGHALFTGQRHLLFGDYLVEAHETAAPLATRLHYGGDTFKTWDDLLEYFDRLGGQ